MQRDRQRRRKARSIASITLPPTFGLAARPAAKLADDGAKLNELQVRYLLRAEERLKLPRGVVQSWTRGGYAPPQFNPDDENALTLEEAYDTLGIAKTVSDKDVKTAYRSKAAEFHPDKLKSKNLPEEFIAFANEQLARINQAHKVIRDARGT